MHKQAWHRAGGGRGRPRGKPPDRPPDRPADRPPGRGGWLLLIGAAVLWGTTGTARALGPPGTSPLSVGPVRMLLGSAALLALAAWQGRLRPPPGRGGAGLPRGLLLVGGAAIAAYQPAFFSAVRLTGVAAGTVIAIGSAPMAAGLLAWAVRGERPGRTWLAATAVAVAGGALLAVAGAPVRLDPLGVALALAAGFSYAAYATVSKDLLERHDPVATTALLFSTAAVLLLPLLALYPPGWLASPRGALLALHLGLLATALAYVLFSYGLTRVPVATAATITLAEPVTAAVLGTVVLGERLTPAGLIGGALVLAGLAILARERPRAGTPRPRSD